MTREPANEKVEDSDPRRARQILATRAFAIVLVLAVALALSWARARDPFRREHLFVDTPAGTMDATAVFPRQGGKVPVVIFVHGAGGELLTDGAALRLIAEQGVAAVGFEYDKTNRANFDGQFGALLRRLQRHPRVRNDSVGWIAQSLGAQNTLNFLARHPELSPRAMVRLNGGRLDDPPNPLPLSTNLSVWLIHGERDESFPAEDSRRLAAFFETNGVPVRLTIVPDQPHSFGKDQPVLIRAAAEFCAKRLGGTGPLRVNERPALRWYWVPSMMLCAGALGFGLRNVLSRAKHGNRALRVAALMVAALALLSSGLHLVLPQMRASPRTLKWTRTWLVRPEWRGDFDWLQEQPPVAGARIGSLLQHLELSELQRRFFLPEPGESDYREFVLSPWIVSDDTDIAWRRTLWEALYPRIRREVRVETAAEIVARFLRERLTIASSEAGRTGRRSISETWESGVTDVEGFERIYTAALRSVGIVARIGGNGRTEFLQNGAWRAAPRPLFDSTMVFN